MSKYYVEKNNESTKDLFRKKTVYRATSVLSVGGVRNIVDMSQAEKIFYGRLDYSFNPINTSNDRISNITRSIEPNNPQRAINFVVDVFNEMALQFEKRAMMGKISKTSNFLSDLKVYKGYQSPAQDYARYRGVYFNSLKAIIRQRNSKIRNFDEFVKLLVPTISDALPQQPLTYSGFLKSNNCSVMNSGLALEIADADYINDDNKVSQFLSDPNWQFFVRTCNTYGFIVDANVPWRIIADIGTPEILTAAGRYSTGATSVTGLLSRFYNSSSVRSYTMFKRHLYELYNMTRVAQFYEIDNCSDGSIIKKLVKSENLTYTQFLEKYPEKYFMNLYIRLRLREEQPKMPENEIEALLRQYLSMIDSDPELVNFHKNFESFINKTFDKSGSLSYLINSSNARDAKKFSTGEIDNVIITDTNNDFSGY